MKEFLIMSMKGGVGKTTLAEAIRQCLGDTEVVDLDPKKSLSVALDIAGVPLCPPKAKYRVYDSPPYNEGALDPILDRVDYILLPARLGYPDLIAFQTMYERLLKSNVTDKALLVFNEERKPLTQEGKEVLKLFRTNYPNMKVANTFITHHEAFRKIFRFPIENEAAEQITSLLSEVFDVVKGKVGRPRREGVRQYGVRLPEKLHTKVKAYCEIHGYGLSQVIQFLLERLLKEDNKSNV